MFLKHILMKTLIPGLILGFSLFACSNQKADLRIQIIGSWAYAEKTDFDYLYNEVFICNDSIRLIDGSNSWSFSYNLVENSIRYDDKTLDVEVINDYTLKLRYDFAQWTLYRILPLIDLNSFKSWGPFYLRRIHFLVNMGYLSIPEAKDSFCQGDMEWVENIEEEEFEILRNSKN